MRVPALPDCVVVNTGENKANVIVALVTDIILLLLVLVGLLRLLHGSGGSFALGRLLWKQVGSERFRFAVTLSINRLIPASQGCHLAPNCHHRRGPTNGTSGVIYCQPSFTHRHVNVTGIHHTGSERYCSLRSGVSVKENELNTMIHVRSAEPRAFLLLRHRRGSQSISFLDTDIPAPVSDCDVNCRGTDVSQSGGLCLRVHGHVLLSSIPVSCAHCCR